MKLTKYLRKIQKHRDAIAAHRDKLNEILADLAGEIDSLNESTECLDDAINSLTHGIESASKYQ